MKFKKINIYFYFFICLIYKQCFNSDQDKVGKKWKLIGEIGEEQVTLIDSIFLDKNLTNDEKYNKILNLIKKHLDSMLKESLDYKADPRLYLLCDRKSLKNIIRYTNEKNYYLLLIELMHKSRDYINEQYSEEAKFFAWKISDFLKQLDFKKILYKEKYEGNKVVKFFKFFLKNKLNYRMHK